MQNTAALYGQLMKQIHRDLPNIKYIWERSDNAGKNVLLFILVIIDRSIMLLYIGVVNKLH